MKGSPAQLIEYILFQLGVEWYVLPVEHVRGIERWSAPTLVPGTPPGILGIISQRGAIVTVVDVRVLLGLPIEPPDRRTRLLGVQWGDIGMALVTDAVADIVALDPAGLEAVAAGRALTLSFGVLHTAAGVASVLDLQALLDAVRAPAP